MNVRNTLAGICLVASSLVVSATAQATPTEAAARGQRLFEAGRFGEAAPVLRSVVSFDSGVDEGARQLAQYQLAVAFYRLGFYQASSAIFAQIADQPSHVRFKQALPWLSKLAIQLPEPADVIERVGKYTSKDLARFDNPEQRDLYWQLNCLLGRYQYRNGNYREAIRSFEKVDAKSKRYVEAQIFMGVSYVQLRKTAPSIEAFERAVKALDEGAETAEDKARMRDLAHLSMARAYFAASVRMGDKAPRKIDVKRRSAPGK
jgi:tetratricopeptide (TPR) repeat protein